MRINLNTFKWLNRIIIAALLMMIACLAAVIILFYNKKNNSAELQNLKVYVIGWNKWNEKIGVETYLRKGKLLFTGEDIEEFNWEQQTVKMTSKFMRTREDNHKTQFIKDIGSGGGSLVLGVSADQRFALILNDELIYSGEFVQSPLSSYMPLGISFGDIYKEGSYFSKDIISDTFMIHKSISSASEGKDADERYNNKLYQFLKENELLKK